MNNSPPTLFLSVAKVCQLTSRIRTYELRAVSGEQLPLITAGSHLTILIYIANNLPELRHYSICSNSMQRDFYKIAVLHEENDNNKDNDISRYMFDRVNEGSILECILPSNNFHVHADASPAILIAGGIGITPIISIAFTLALRGRRFQLHYAGRCKQEMAFVDELETQFTTQLHIYSAAENSRLNVMHLLADAPSNAIFYACGPQKMLADIATSAHMLGITTDRIQMEYFATETSNKNAAVVLELAHSNKLINVNTDQSLLNAVRAAGVNINFDCCMGDCGSCAVKILEGEAEHRDHVLSDSQKNQGFICLCVSRAKSDKLVLAL